MWSFRYLYQVLSTNKKLANNVFIYGESISVAWYTYNRSPQQKQSHINIVLVYPIEPKCDADIIRFNISNFVGDFFHVSGKKKHAFQVTSRIDTREVSLPWALHVGGKSDGGGRSVAID